jgi:hypothetical protein
MTPFSFGEDYFHADTSKAIYLYIVDTSLKNVLGFKFYLFLEKY